MAQFRGTVARKEISLQTRDFGNVSISEEEILHFPNGVFAFENVHKFTVLHPLGEGVYPMWLQAVSNVHPCFVVFDPQKLVSGYSLELTANEYALIGAQPGDALSCLVMAVVHDDYRQTTVNLKSPVVINPMKRLAAQFILPQAYPVRYTIYGQGRGE